jgi:hypothetical protein
MFIGWEFPGLRHKQGINPWKNDNLVQTSKLAFIRWLHASFTSHIASFWSVVLLHNPLASTIQL